MAKEFHKLRVAEKRKETDEAVTLRFEVPDQLKDTFDYTHGQYLTLRFQVNGSEERRAYSMSSSPQEDRLAVTVKKVYKGVVSTHIHDRVSEGEEVDVMPPEGRFHTQLEPEQRKTYYLFGAGSGITPLMSILKTVLEREPKSEIYLLYGNRNEDSIIFRDELEELQARYEGQLHVTHILSQPKREKGKGLKGLFSKGKTSWDGLVGHCNAQQVKAFLDKHPARTEQAEYFICGPGQMNRDLENSLAARGISKDRIHVEHFLTEPPGTKASSSKSGLNGHAHVAVTLDGKRMDIEVAKGKTILDTLLDLGEDPPYSCTAGACSTCMAKVLKGSVQMDTCLALDEEEIQQGYILTCQSHPTSSELEITYDD